MNDVTIITLWNLHIQLIKGNSHTVFVFFKKEQTSYMIDYSLKINDENDYKYKHILAKLWRKTQILVKFILHYMYVASVNVESNIYRYI